jgi:hypothetical protein
MKGHIRERSPGHWAIVLESRDPETGKRRRRWHTFVGTKRQAQVECSRLIVEISAGTYVDPTRETVAAFLERWIEHIKGQVAPRSHERYAEIARKNVVPLLGGLTLSKLQPVHIKRGLRQSARQRPQERQGRPIRTDGTSHASSIAPGAAAGRPVATARTKSLRCREAAEGGASADGGAGHRSNH